MIHAFFLYLKHVICVFSGDDPENISSSGTEEETTDAEDEEEEPQEEEVKVQEEQELLGKKTHDTWFLFYLNFKSCGLNWQSTLQILSQYIRVQYFNWYHADHTRTTHNIS